MSGGKFELSPERRKLLERLLQEEGMHGLASRITPGPRPEAIPLSYAQERLWFLDQLEPNTGLYNIPALHRLKSPLNLPALEDSLTEVVRRHEALRTTFELSGGQPVQVIHPPAPFKLEVTAVPGLDAAGREAEARRLALRDAREPFDLWRGPLLRARLLRLAEDEHILLVVMHHIVSDGWSMGVLFKELDALYAAFAAGRPSPLQELPIQYADFALWQRGHLRGEVLERHLAYWREQLRGAPPVSGLPSDRPRPPVQSFRGAVEGFALGRGLTSSLKAVARREGATLFMTLLAGFQALVARYTGRGDVVVGTPIANRNRAELEGLIGFFVNTLVLRARVGDDPSFAELLGRVRRTTLEAYAHQDVPFEKLVEELGPERDLSHNPLFQVMFILQNAPGVGGGESAPEEAAPAPPPDGGVGEVGTSKFDLTLAVTEAGGGLAGAAEYNTDLFDGETVRRMVSHWRRLLEGAAADPSQRISRLPMLTEEERHEQLVEWNDTGAPFPSGACVHELFEEQAEQGPGRTAVEWRGETVSYGELNRLAGRVASYLRGRGVGPEVRVGVSVGRGVGMLAAVLGVLKAGGAYVPLDPAYPEERRRYMLEDAGVAVTLGEAEVAEALAREDDAAAVEVGGGARPGNLAYVIYTSGSTGRPKGVAVPHQLLVNLLAWQARHPNLPAPVRTLQFASLSFDVSFQEIFSTLTTGGTLVLVDDELRREPSQLLAYLGEARVARLFLPPVALAQLAEAASQSNLPDTVRQIYVAGEALQLTKAIRRLLEGAVDCKLYNQYGPTEAHVVSEYPVERESAQFPPIGKPISNQRLYILDENLNPVPRGVTGEVFIAGGLLARGYLGQKGATAERFLPDPFSEVAGMRMYRTGDSGRWLRGGDIQLSGRTDYQLKIRGFRVEPGEVEAAVAELPGVRQAAVAGWEPTPGDRSLVAYVVLSPGATLSVGQMQALRSKLPEYLIPSRLLILDALPLTPTGKVDRRALPPPDNARPELEEGFTPPSTAIEEMLASIWSAVLGLESVGIHDNFFALGGHSLRATQVTSRIREEFEIDFPVRLVFEKPTIAEMALAVAQLWADSVNAEELAGALDDLDNKPAAVPEDDHV